MPGENGISLIGGLLRRSGLLAWVVLFGLLGSGTASAEIDIDSATLNGGATVSVSPGASITANLGVSTSGSGSNDNWSCTRWAIASTQPGAGSMNENDSPDFDGDGSHDFSFAITAPTTPGTYNAYFIAYNNDNCNGQNSGVFTLSNAVLVDASPRVSSINRASFDPSSAGTSVLWTVVFSDAVTGVDAADFALVQAGGATGAAIQSVVGAGTTWTVTATTGTGSGGTLRLDLVDNDSIRGSTNLALGGAGNGNGNFTGQFYTLLPTICTPGLIYCDDFERSNPQAVGNGWTITPDNANDCNGTSGNRGCAGIDFDIPPFNNLANPRANPSRSMFTRWAEVWVDSPVINLAGRPGGQFSFWMRRGSDTFSEYPEATGENYLVRYYASDGTWKVLAQYPSGVQQGQVFTPTIELPPDALHANFRLRFYQPSGSGDSGSGGAPGVRGYDYWHLDNVIIRESPGSTFTGAFCDNFEGGLGRWSISSEGAPGSASIGDASLGTLTFQSANNSLNMRWGYVSAATFKTDLSGVGGSISYWVRSGTNDTRDPDNNENLVVEYLNNAGNWIGLATYLGSASSGTIFNGNHALPADATHAGFRLRFRTLAGSGYDRDYWHIDDVCVGDPLPSADLALSKTRSGALVPGGNANYLLTVTNNGPGTLAGSIEVVDTLPAGLSYLSHSGSGWSCGVNEPVVTCGWSGTLAPGAVAPVLTLTVRVDASASGTLVNTATVSGTVNDPIPGNNTASDSTSLFSPSYVLTDAPCTHNVPIGSGCNLVQWSPQTAGATLNGIYITALNASGVPTRLNASSATTLGFQFAMSCINPVANAGIQARFSAISVPLPLCAGNGAVPGSWSAAANLSFPAGSPSTGPYSFSYDDVGRVELYLRNSAATSQMGSSGAFVVKPYTLVLTDIQQTAAPQLANPAATSATGSRFVRAGEAFSATLTALNLSCAASVASYRLLADIPVACRTPNFGRESVAEAVSLSATLVGGLGLTNNPAITNAGVFGAFSGGSATGTSFAWDEVGIITLTPTVADGDYLGGGPVAATSSANVGRFFADHFDLVLTPQCAGFTYAGQPAVPGQPFTVVATARSASGDTTLNYNAASGFAKALNLTLASGGAVGSLYVDAVAGGNGAIPASAYVVGVGQVAHNAPSGRISYVFSTFPTVMTAIAVHGEDADSASGAAILAGSDGTTSARAGRLHLANAYGSELLPLNVPARIQSWTASGWVTHASDSCTVLTTPTNANGGLSNTLSTKTSVSPAPVVAAGAISLRLTTPGAGNAGLVDISGNVLRGSNTWLTLPVPSARACFGVCGPRSPVIYYREQY